MENPYQLLENIEFKQDEDIAELTDFQLFLLSIFLASPDDTEDE